MNFASIFDVFQLFFPSTCAVCGNSLRYSEKLLCTNCIVDIPRVHIHNKEHNPLEKLLWGRVPFEKATAYFNYTKKNNYAILLHNLKYKKQIDLGIFLGESFGCELKNSGFTDTIDVIIPVPLHKKREQKRGYNQSTIIAQGISNVTNIQMIDDAIIRTKNTQTQTQKNKEERERNVENIFEVINTTALENKHILLLDDVITTGATSISCAEAILEQGFVSKISIASLAIAR